MKHLIRELRYWKQDTLAAIGDWLKGKEDALWYWSTIPAACLGWGAVFGFIAWLIIPAFAVWVSVLTSVAAYWLYTEQS